VRGLRKEMFPEAACPTTFWNQVLVPEPWVVEAKSILSHLSVLEQAWGEIL
jgi:hypothetical protein